MSQLPDVQAELSKPEMKFRIGLAGYLDAYEKNPGWESEVKLHGFLRATTAAHPEWGLDFKNRTPLNQQLLQMPPASLTYLGRGLPIDSRLRMDIQSLDTRIGALPSLDVSSPEKFAGTQEALRHFENWVALEIYAAFNEGVRDFSPFLDAIAKKLTPAQALIMTVDGYASGFNANDFTRAAFYNRARSARNGTVLQPELDKMYEAFMEAYDSSLSEGSEVPPPRPDASLNFAAKAGYFQGRFNKERDVLLNESPLLRNEARLGW